jgi:NADH:ubiquinone oxidoreductase subunit K
MNATILCAALIAVGLYGVLTRRDLVAVLASIEVMLGGANLLLVAMSTTYKFAQTAVASRYGASLALIILVLVAAEAAVGLALLVALVRRRRTRVDDIEELAG